MTIGMPPINAGPVGAWTNHCTLKVPTYGHDSSGHPTVSSTTDVSNLPCHIDDTGSSETLKYGTGAAHESARVFIGYFPLVKADGTALSIPASATVVVGSTVYTVKGAGQEYGGGIQTAPLEIRA